VDAAPTRGDRVDIELHDLTPGKESSVSSSRALPSALASPNWGAITAPLHT